MKNTNDKNNIVVTNETKFDFRTLVKRIGERQFIGIDELQAGGMSVAEDSEARKNGRTEFVTKETGGQYKRNEIEAGLLRSLQTMGRQTSFSQEYEFINFLADTTPEALQETLSIGVKELRQKVNSYLNDLRTFNQIEFANDSLSDGDVFELVQTFCNSQKLLGLEYLPITEEMRKEADTKRDTMQSEFDAEKLAFRNKLVAEIREQLQTVEVTTESDTVSTV